MVAASQIVQELPASDRKSWRADMERPETADERAERQMREVERRGFGPTSLAHAADWARRRLALLAFGVAPALVAGCLPLDMILPSPEPIACVAHYQPLLPGVLLGQDGCGNVWVLDAEHGCFMTGPDGGTIQIECPAEGDTLAVVKETQ
jgi:hypothetical protein